jgi:hypothetical protein
VTQKLNARPLIRIVGRRELVIPKEGWTAASFRAHGGPMVMTLHRLARLITRRQTAEIARRLAALLNAQIELVIERVKARHAHPFRRAAKADLNLPGDPHLWAEVLEEVLREFDPKVIARVMPPLQSTMDQGYSKTSLLLGQAADISRSNTALQTRARALALKVTRISETTRVRLAKVIADAVDGGLTLLETAAKVSEVMPRINGARAMTIARTETGNAWSQGAIQSFKESRTITLVSVIGCESREEDRWETPSYAPFLYRGESTCNIEDVPVADIDKLNFHPNHTGTMVPSGFTED